MAELKKKATRESYGEALAELGDKYENLYVFDADLAAATKTGIFKKKFPDRFFDCGIAESNMMGVAAGMAATGKIPFASTFAMFAAGRAFEQVRNSIGYPHLNVKIGATHAGISVGEDGATHQCNEDIALMRTIPGMVVINPADDVEAKAAVEAAILHEGPVYLRFGRLATPVFNDPETYKFELGKGVKLRDGKDIAIVATGLMVYEAIEAAKASVSSPPPGCSGVSGCPGVNGSLSEPPQATIDRTASSRNGSNSNFFISLYLYYLFDTKVDCPGRTFCR